MRSRVGLEHYSKRLGPKRQRGVYLYRLGPKASAGAILKKLRADKRVEAAEPDDVYRVNGLPNDPSFGQQWGLNNTGQTILGTSGAVDADVDAPEAWGLRNDEASATVAVIDTGIDQGHPDLAGRLWTNNDEPGGNALDDDANGYIDDANGYNFAGISQTWAYYMYYFGDPADPYRQEAQSIKGTGRPLTDIGLLLSKRGAPTPDLLVSVRQNIDGPDLASVTILASEVPQWGAVAEIYKSLSAPVTLNTGTTYYIVVKLTGNPSLYNATNTYMLGFNPLGYSYYMLDPYRDGNQIRGQGVGGAPTWTQYASNDLYFRTNSNANPRDDHGHGTHVGGIVGAVIDNATGVAGVAPKVKLMPLKAADCSGSFKRSDIINAIYYAADNGAKVINMSFGGPSYSSLVQSAIDYARAKGVVLFAAVGNDGNATMNYPAGYSNVIGVGATDNQDNRATFSNYNTSVDISAPGRRIYSTIPTYPVAFTSQGVALNYDFLSGTSMASPMAAGVAALLLTGHRTVSPATLETALAGAADDKGAPGYDTSFGYGRLSGSQALMSLEATATLSYKFAWAAYGPGNTPVGSPAGLATDASHNQVFKKAWGAAGAGAGQFNGPAATAADTAGNIYVADGGNNRIEKFDAAGGFESAWGSVGSANGQFMDPSGIAVDSTGNVYVADTGNNRIQEFSATGSYVMKWGRNGGDGSAGTGRGEFTQPSAVAVDPATGILYVTDDNRVQRFTAAGTYIDQWGSAGGANGQFMNPSGIAVDSTGNVYVADTGNDRIQKFESDGTFLTKWGTTGAGDGQFNQPGGVSVDRAGRVYVADTLNHRLQEFSSTGRVIAKWGAPGAGAGKFSGPGGVSVDSAGNVYVADTLNHRLQKFGANGYIYVADRDRNRVVKYTAGGVYAGEWGVPGVGAGLFSAPEAAAVDADGNAYVADTGNHRIQKFSADGAYLGKWGRNGGDGSAGTGAGEFTSPAGIAADPASGYIYVTDEHRVQRFDANGVYLGGWGSFGSGAGQFDRPKGIGVDAAGDVLVADSGNNRIEKFDPAGNLLVQWGTFGSGNGQLKAPGGVAVDSKGGVFVADTGNNRVQEFSPNGVYMGKWGKNSGDGSAGGFEGDFSGPRGVALDGGGAFYVADASNYRIEKFDIDLPGGGQNSNPPATGANLYLLMAVALAMIAAGGGMINIGGEVCHRS